jgi:hypothetical protein
LRHTKTIHVDENHAIIIKRFQEEVNSLMNEKKANATIKKKGAKYFWKIYPKRIFCGRLFQKDDVQQQQKKEKVS